MSDQLLELTANIVASHVSHNAVQKEELPGLIRSVYSSLHQAAANKTETQPAKPMVPVKASVYPDHLVCLECGKSFRVLRRHIQTEHDMSPDQYRARFGLPSNYPVVAPQYAEVRSALAKKIGLGRSREARQPRRLPPPQKKAAGGSRRSA